MAMLWPQQTFVTKGTAFLCLWSLAQELRDIVSPRAMNTFLESTPELLFGFVDLGWGQGMWIC